MTKSYKSRKQMERENFTNFDATKMSREEVEKYIKSLGFERFYFHTVAVSHGTYGANGAIIDVETKTDVQETIVSFSILSRSTTLLQFL